MIAEIGHYALILALGVAIVQTVLPLWGTRSRDPQLMAIAAPAAQMQFLLIALAFTALMTAYVTSDFSVENVWRNSHSAKPLIYKIAGVWGNHEGSMVLWVLMLALFGAAVATFGNNLPRQLQANVLGRPSLDRRRFPPLHHHHVEPVHAADARAFRRQWAEPRAAGSRARVSSTVPLRGLCRILDGVLVRHRGIDRRTHRRCVGALGQTLDACRLDVPHHRNRDGILVGLLRARVGRVLVLGPGRERVLHAVARGHGAPALGPRDGKARSAQSLDDPPCDHHLRPVTDGHVPRSLRRAHVRACVCR